MVLKKCGLETLPILLYFVGDYRIGYVQCDETKG